MARTALPTFNDRSAELTLVFWDGTTATGNLLGQVQSFEWTSELDSRDTYRVGDSTRHTVYTSINANWTMSLYEDDDMSELALAIDNTDKPTAGGWLGTESIALATTDSGVTVTIASYDGEATTSALLYTETLTTARTESVTRTVTANEVNVWNFSGRAATVALVPEAGTGA